MGGGGEETTTETREPWMPAQPGLMKGINKAVDMFGKGEFDVDPYSGDRVVGFGPLSQIGQGAAAYRAAQGTPLVDQASGSLSDMMSADYQNEQLQGVQDAALDKAIPAAVAQFSGAGMGNSGLAMDTVGQAAADAVAPYEYGAWNSAQDRAIGAASLSPQMEEAGYLSSQMLGKIGGQRDAMAQRELDAMLGQFYETQENPIQGLERYSGLLLGYGGAGGTSTSTSSVDRGPMDMLGGVLQGASLAGMAFPGLFPASWMG